MLKKAIFLDRDGTLNQDSSYVYRIEDLKILPGVKEGLEVFKKLGYHLIIVTNQSGIGRGYFSLQDAENFNTALIQKLEIDFDAIYLCPHLASDQCDCRKPHPTFVLQATEKFGLSLQDSYFIGDKASDILCGQQAGTQTVFIKNDLYPLGDLEPDYQVTTLREFAQILSTTL